MAKLFEKLHFTSTVKLPSALKCCYHYKTVFHDQCIPVVFYQGLEFNFIFGALTCSSALLRSAPHFTLTITILCLWRSCPRLVKKGEASLTKTNHCMEQIQSYHSLRKTVKWPRHSYFWNGNAKIKKSNCSEVATST